MLCSVFEGNRHESTKIKAFADRVQVAAGRALFRHPTMGIALLVKMRFTGLEHSIRTRGESPLKTIVL